MQSHHPSAPSEPSRQSDTLELSLAGPNDIEDVLPLFRAYQDHYGQLTTASEAKTKEFLRGLVSQTDTGFMLVARSNGAPIGFAAVYLTVSGLLAERLAHLGDLYVQPAFRRAGLGTRLFQAVVEEARRRGVPRVRWLSLSTNTELSDWYGTLGDCPGEFRLYLASTTA